MKPEKLTIVAVKAYALGYFDGRTGVTEKPPYQSQYLSDWYIRGKDAGLADNYRTRELHNEDQL